MNIHAAPPRQEQKVVKIDPFYTFKLHNTFILIIMISYLKMPMIVQITLQIMVAKLSGYILIRRVH